MKEIIERLDKIISLLDKPAYKRKEGLPAIHRKYSEIEDFIKNNCILGNQLVISTRELLTVSRINQRALSIFLQRIGVTAGRAIIEGKQVRCYFGIGLKNNIV